MTKTFTSVDFSDVEKNVPDVVSFGNGNQFQLLCKASSKKEGWMKSTKAMQIDGIGCVVQVTTQQDGQIAEALTFVPGAVIQNDKFGGRELVLQK